MDSPAEGTPNPPARLGSYHLLRELGRGAMGTVYLAWQESLARDLAIKILAPEFTREPEFQERFRREARIAASLRHPHIVQVYDADFRDGVYYIAMEYVGPRNLRQVMEERKGPFPVAEALPILESILQALGHAHSRGVVHRDVKPANVLVDDEGRVALTDFSIARAASETGMTRSGAMIGTPDYMAPEQFESLEVDGRTDLYAAGVIAYELLTGVHPFRADSTAAVMKAHLFKRAPAPSELVASLRAFDPVLARALEKDPDARYRTAEEFCKALLAAGGLDTEQKRLDEFLAAILQGRISMDEAVRAHALVKEAIDQEFRRVQTVLIADLAGSSKLKQPDRTLQTDSMFRAFRKAVNEALETRGCRSFDWSGDGVLGLFDSAGDAVLAGLEIQARLEEFCRSWGQPGVLSARIGLNTGSLYLDPRRSLGEFASRTVDQTGHLQKDCPPGAVALSEATAKAAGPVASYAALGKNRDGVEVLLAHPLGAPVPCPSCGHSVPAGGRFCPGCGRNLSLAPAPAEPAAPAAPGARSAPVDPARPPSGSGGHGAPSPPPPSGSGGHGAPSPPPPSGSGGHGAPSAPPPSGSGGHGAPSAPPPSGSGGHGVPSAPPPSGSGGHGAPSAPPPSGSGGHGAPSTAEVTLPPWPPGTTPPSPPAVLPISPPAVLPISPPTVPPISPPSPAGGWSPSRPGAPARPSPTLPGTAPAPPAEGGSFWWGWAMLAGLLLLMFAGGLVGAETPLGGSLVFGGFVGLCCLGLVAPVLALLFFVRARVGPGLQAAALSGLLWALVALIAWAGLRG